MPHPIINESDYVEINSSKYSLSDLEAKCKGSFNKNYSPIDNIHVMLCLVTEIKELKEEIKELKLRENGQSYII